MKHSSDRRVSISKFVILNLTKIFFPSKIWSNVFYALGHRVENEIDMVVINFKINFVEI